MFHLGGKNLISIYKNFINVSFVYENWIIILIKVHWFKNTFLPLLCNTCQQSFNFYWFQYEFYHDFNMDSIVISIWIFIDFNKDFHWFQHWFLLIPTWIQLRFQNGFLSDFNVDFNLLQRGFFIVILIGI